VRERLSKNRSTRSKIEEEEAEEEDLVLLNQLVVKQKPIISSNF